MKPTIIPLPYGSFLKCALILCEEPHTAFFDSASGEGRTEQDRYSFVAAFPYEVLRDGGGDPFSHVQQKLAPLSVNPKEVESFSFPPPPFFGGFAGVFGYEIAARLEKLTLPALTAQDAPAFFGGMYDMILYADHKEKFSAILSTGLPENDPDRQKTRAEHRAECFKNVLLTRLKSYVPQKFIPLSALPECNFTHESYAENVKTAMEKIKAGDIFQVNLSRKLTAPLPENFSSLGFYNHLRSVNPAPFAFYYHGEHFRICSASPERFISVHGDRAETRPIKGTIRKTGVYETDQKNLKILLDSEKDRAENIMIADLLRNDLSKNAVTGSVRVESLCAPESYEGLYHLVTTISARKAPNATALDLLRDCFPGGSITGAPKIRACEIIAELEKTPRGAYCGAAVYADCLGNADSNLLIRTATVTDQTVTFHSGGGVTALSDPENEYRETEVKADRILKGLYG